MGLLRGPQRRGRSATIRLVLAAGLVLGVSAGATLALWNDPEYAKASFVAGTFNTVSSANGTTYASNITTPGVQLTLNSAVMLPGSTVDAAIAIAAAGNVNGTGIGSGAGTLTMAAPTVVNTPNTAPLLGSALQYRAYSYTTGTIASCTPTSSGAAGSYLVGSSTTYAPLTTAGSTTPAFAAASGSTAGAPTFVCFQVNLPAYNSTTATPSNALQGDNVQVAWTFTATSNQ